MLVLSAISVGAWTQWNYTTQWNAKTATAAAAAETSWYLLWNNVSAPGLDKSAENAPRPRRGHTMDFFVSNSTGDLGFFTYIVIFGGRDNENPNFRHIPKTYDVERRNGVLVFSTYDDKPVNACNDIAGTYYTEAERAGCDYDEASLIVAGVFYNDVWAYKMCTRSQEPYSTPGFGPLDTFSAPSDPKRYFDSPCVDGGWLLWDAGASEGGCVIQLGILVCTRPSERYLHTSALFDDGTMYIYGGFSQRCEDYCDDLWMFDVYRGGWKELYSSSLQNNLSKLYYDTIAGATYSYSQAEVPVDNSTQGNAGPGKRWRHTMVKGKRYEITDSDGSTLHRQRVALFGGHRLWHGFGGENNYENNWENFDTFPYGGYLHDLWIFTKHLDFETPTGAGAGFRESDGLWQYIFPQEECYSTPGIAWNERFDTTCITIWPPARAGHGAAYDTPRNGLWIFGGYSTYYPYLKTDGEGSGLGVTQTNRGGFIPFPGFSYYKNDLWFFNFTSGYWAEHVYDPTVHHAWPDGRTDHIFLLLQASVPTAPEKGHILFLDGGYADNYFYEDTWYYYIETGQWLEKTEFVYPEYPTSCTDDLEYIDNNDCSKLTWPKHLRRERYYPFQVVPYSSQEYYWPDSENGPYFGIKPRGYEQRFHEIDFTDMSETDTTLEYKDTAPIGTPIAPYAATGTMQYVKEFTYAFNETHDGVIKESCTSVYAEPTRGMTIDGLAGRASSPVRIAQPRRQRPGWDGCVTRADGRTDLPDQLTYVRPRARSGHDAVWLEATNEIIMYGGHSYHVRQPKSIQNSWDTVTRDDMWYFNLYHCINNCSDHGVCQDGFCKCYVGYYGEDCSNTSCPGTSCYYDEYTKKQVCRHACQAGYNHTDNDVYVPDITKIPCTRGSPGEVNGVCNGFGTTQCAPPYVGDDCGTKDCKSNCSFNGWCSIEYPVSRCMCQPGYFGEICQYKLCLNNCSFPNGVCNTTTGFCKCRNLHSPFNMTRVFKPWEGEDCSWMWAYQAAPRSTSSFNLWVSTVIALCVALYLAAPSWASSQSLGNLLADRTKARSVTQTGDTRRRSGLDVPT